MSQWEECAEAEAEEYRYRIRGAGQEWMPWSDKVVPGGYIHHHTQYEFRKRKVIEPPSGYYILSDEEKEAGLKPGDRWWGGKNWLHSMNAERNKTAAECTYARKIAIDPGEGYRLLENGERLEQGDEYWSLDEWRKSSDAGLPANRGGTASVEKGLIYRRRIKPEHRKEYPIIRERCGWEAIVKGRAVALAYLPGMQDKDGRTFVGFKNGDGLAPTYGAVAWGKMATHAVFEFVTQGS